MSSPAAHIAGWLRQQLHAAGAKGFVLGLSGGVDSAVVARLCQMAAPGRVLGVLLPCHSDPRDEQDAALAASSAGLSTVRVDLQEPYDALVRQAEGALRTVPAGLGGAGVNPAEDPRARLPLANIKPRLRMTMLYAVANELNLLVAGTGNRSELAIGYFTKYGDGGVDLLPLGRLVKQQVRELARGLDVPASIIEKPPSAGLWLGQTDEAEMGFSYDDLDAYLLKGPQAVAPAVAARIERMVLASEHKRTGPPMPDPL